MQTFLTRFVRDRSGATAIEYGLIIALVFLVMLVSLQAFAGNASSGLVEAMGLITDAIT